MTVLAKTCRRALLSGFLLVQAYATAVVPPIFSTGDSCPEYQLCDRLPKEFNISGAYILPDHQVYCQMEEGRWTTLLRRGVNASGTYLDQPKQSFNVSELQQGFGYSSSAEFFLGVDKTMALLEGDQDFQLRVDLTDQDDIKYFSVFNGIKASGQPAALSVSESHYLYGNAGDGNLRALDGALFNYDCTPAGWWTPVSVDTTCSAETLEGPFLTGPLNEPNFREGVYAWPTLPKTLKAITLSIRTEPTSGAECESDKFAFDGEVLQDVTMTMNNLEVGSSFKISCNDPEEVIPTIANGVLENSRENSATFTCGTGATMNRIPAISGHPCMKNCAPDQGLYVGGEDYYGNKHGGPNCLSLRSGTVTSLLEAAKACGEDGLQLLDHLVPATAIQPQPTEATVYWLNAWMNATDGENLYDAQGNVLGPYTSGASCVSMTAGPDLSKLSYTPCDTTGVNEGLNYICKTQTACSETQLFDKGFCYESVTTSAISHLEECAQRGGSPTADLDVIKRLLEQDPSPENRGVIVGIYKRDNKFWRPGGEVAEESEFDGGVGGATDNCAILPDADSSMLRAVPCEEEEYRVFCQTPGYASDGESRCSVHPDLFIESSAVVPAEVQSGGDDWSKIGSQLTASCPDGHRLYTKEGPTRAEFTCQGLQLEWMIQENTEVQGIGPGALPSCVLACDLPMEDTAPENSNMTVEGSNVVHTCHSTLRIESGATQQQQTCEAVTPSWSPEISTLQSCDHCLLSPFVPGPNSTLIVEPDGDLPQQVGSVVVYKCKPGLTTPNGTTVQTQSCTASGWVGDIVECTFCEDMPFSVLHAVETHTDTLGFGQMYNFTCLPGLASSQAETEMLALCTPDGWNMCQMDFNCTHCTGSPPNITGMELITWNWDESANEMDTMVTYTCSPGLGTATLASEQTANCTSEGWQQDILPCSYCLNPPVGNHTTIGSTEERGNGTLGSSLIFHCAEGLQTDQQQESITSVCNNTGWSHCEQDIRCPQCAPLPDLSTWNSTLTWDYSGNNTFGAVVTLTCNPGTATEDTFLEVQTVVCDIGGWNVSEVLPCTVCNQAPPNGTASMHPVQWTLGVEEVEYLCRDEFQLPWNATSYTSFCTASGWSECVPECSHCRPEEVNLPHVVTVSVMTNATAVYNCSSEGIQTANGSTVQELTCTEEGWSGGPVLDCDTCTGDAPEAAPGQNRTWDGSALLEASAEYLCAEGLVTATGKTQQTVTCTETGWTEPPANCDHCPLLDLQESYENDWTGNSSMVPQGTDVTFTCPNGSRLLSTNSSQQSLMCGDEGWTPELEDCVACLEDIPEAVSNGTDARNVTWDGGRQLGDSAEYVCLDTGLRQTVTCDDFQWTPSDLGPCGQLQVCFSPERFQRQGCPPVGAGVRVRC